MTALQREERIGDCRLILGESLSALPELEAIDAIVTDPPYSSGGFTQSSISKAKGMGLRSETLKKEGWFAGDAMTAAGGAFLLREVAAAAFDRSAPGATLTVFTDWRVSALYAPAIESARWRYQNLLVWDKGNAGLGSGFRAQHELALHFSKGSPPYYSSQYGNVLKCPRVPNGQKQHQTEKPVGLLRQILETVSDFGHVVFDPFMGSGSTLVACAQMGRKGIGVEIDEGHFETACRRVEEAYKNPPLFAPPAPEAEQAGLDL